MPANVRSPTGIVHFRVAPVAAARRWKVFVGRSKG